MKKYINKKNALIKNAFINKHYSPIANILFSQHKVQRHAVLWPCFIGYIGGQFSSVILQKKFIYQQNVVKKRVKTVPNKIGVLLFLSCELYAVCGST